MRLFGGFVQDTRCYYCSKVAIVGTKPENGKKAKKLTAGLKIPRARVSPNYILFSRVLHISHILQRDWGLIGTEHGMHRVADNIVWVVNALNIADFIRTLHRELPRFQGLETTGCSQDYAHSLYSRRCKEVV